MGLCERPDCCFLSLRCVTEGEDVVALDVFVSVALHRGASELAHCLIRKTLRPRPPHSSGLYPASHNHTPNKVSGSEGPSLSFTTHLSVK